jgi:transcriptional regulator with XRE-family HTH domain
MSHVKRGLVLHYQAVIYNGRMGFGRNLARIRKIRKISQLQLGKELGVTDAAVSQWEAEKTVPELSRIPIIAKCLGVPIGALFDEDPGLTREDRAILDLLSVINPNDKAGMLAVLQTLWRTKG